MHWRDAIRNRFADREEIGKDELYARYFQEAGLPKAEVFKCLDLIEAEYEIPSGLLRPEDNISKLTAPVETKNLWKRFVYQGIAGDRENELGYQLNKQMQQYGVERLGARIETINDLILTWCGQKLRSR